MNIRYLPDLKRTVLSLLLVANSTVALADDTCDVGKLSIKVKERYELPELPSALEDCGISGFLDFAIGIAGDGFSSMFCDFAETAIGNFQERLTIDFEFDEDGFSIESPIYSVSTPSIKDLVEDSVWDAVGGEPEDGILDSLADAYDDSLTNVRGSIEATSNTTTTTQSIEDFQAAVLSTGLSSDDVTNASASISTVSTSVDISSDEPEYSDILTDSQLDVFNSLSEAQLDSLDDDSLTSVLGLTVDQQIDLGLIEASNVTIIEEPPTEDTSSSDALTNTDEVNQALLESLFGSDDENDQ